MFNFYTTWKRHKISGFPMFSGGIEIEHIGWKCFKHICIGEQYFSWFPISIVFDKKTADWVGVQLYYTVYNNDVIPIASKRGVSILSKQNCVITHKLVLILNVFVCFEVTVIIPSRPMLFRFCELFTLLYILFGIYVFWTSYVRSIYVPCPGGTKAVVRTCSV